MDFRYLLSRLFRNRFGWSVKGDLKSKEYDSYGEYLRHQKEKLDVVGDGFRSEIDKFEGILRARLRNDKIVWNGKSVLCLGARLGQEVRAFNGLGCFAVGVDLNPGKDNKNVVVGDFHDLVWRSSCVDVVYTNSLDHSFDVNRVIDEIRRVLKRDGIVVLDLNLGSEEGYEYGYYESIAWDKVGDIVKMFNEKGFCLIDSNDFTIPFIGRHIIMGTGLQ
jgi:SAM-dependent methyltransferase